jgi:Xaa-Pro aminopeptidase
MTNDKLVRMNADFFRGNRIALQERLKTGALVVIAGYGEMQRGHDAAHPFEQEGSFWYLTGIEAPDWWLIIDGRKSYAVAPHIDVIKQTFDGSLSPGLAQEISGVDAVIDRDEAMTRLRDAKRQHTVVYTIDQPVFIREHASFHLNPAQGELKAILERTFQSVVDCGQHVSALRTIKQPQEIAAIEHAVKLTCDAFKKMKSELGRYKYEYEAEARMTYEIRRHGADGHAYTPIVADGHNACTLHYVHNDTKLTKKSLLLMDVGARIGGYAADISRTYAVGQPTKRQIAVHDAVRQAQAQIIKLLKPGLGFVEYQHQVDTIMVEALKSLKLDPEKLHQYMPHAVGHGLGIDVHDTLAGYDSLQPGMVLTVEPGIYLPDENIGVRIEDDILITDSGHKNLSGSLSTVY